MAKLDLPTVPLAIEHNVAMPMRDGTLLRADIYRPAQGTPFPALLVRTPYGEPSVRTAPVLPAIDAGFAVVLQYCRGTGTSDGDFTPFESESDDGVDSIEWCARQDWCDGRVGMWGASYVGMVQLAAAVQAPSALKCLLPIVTPADYYGGLAYRQGAFQLGQLLAWYTMKSAQTLGYRALAGEDVSADGPELAAHVADIANHYRYLPAREMPAVSRIIPGWQRWLDHDRYDQYWREVSYAARRHRITTPALHVGGWFDLFLGGTLDNYQTLRSSAATEHARRHQALIVGPWTHGDQTGTAGELHFGMASSAQAIGLEQLQVGFLRTFINGEERERGALRVKLFVMGDNVWRDEEDWPLARTVWTRWYLHADGGLSPEAPPADAPASRYRYDPADPVPTAGGPTLIPASPDGSVSWMAGPRDQRAIEARSDVLSFTSDVLPEDLEVTGPLVVTLHAATSAADTDFTARLVDVWPDGRAIGIADGIVRARYRDGSGQPAPVTPGRVYDYSIDMIGTSQVFKTGHRVRVDIASSNFPCFDRNPGNGAPAATATERDFVIAEQTMCHDAAHPSFITLPVIPRG
ncbi:MAG TPA: CocE/NonD family hydrolase [Streptosporangiaceae bacterium]|nr:CocE/NonD family hydrolase [Streptosporangiaceae bacterium]